ncbi:MAG: DNA adenine methylase [Thermomicrobiales bacterium]
MTHASQASLFSRDEMEQQSDAAGQIVNVASVPQRSPFRYPGGKTWLVPHIRQWFAQMAVKPSTFIEPFAGGGIISLTVAFEGLADHVIMVELDDDVAAVWETILDGRGGGEWLASKIVHFDLTSEAVQARLSCIPSDTRERAFTTILKNRVKHGGILAPGASMVKHGENGKGLKSRWYPQTLSQRILAIVAVRDRINITHGDGMAVMRHYAKRRDVVFFIDPPYTAGGKRAGSRLYTHSVMDHAELFRVAASLTGDFLMTYDDATELHELASHYAFDTMLVPMKNTHHAKMKELLIGRNLDWARESSC